MRTVVSCALWLLLAGCVYEVPLVTESKQDVNKDLLGRWETVGDDGRLMPLLVLPWGAREYLVQYPATDKDGLFFRAFVAQTGDEPLLQFQCLGTSAGQLPDSPRVYHYGTFRLNGKQLVLRLINPEVVSKDIKTPQALAQAIAERRGQPDLFGDQTVFTRVAAE